MNYLISKDRFGFRYKEANLNSAGWKPLPLTITDIEGIRQYFEAGKHTRTPGRYDTPTLSFVDENMKPTVYWNVSPDKKFAVANFDKSKFVLFQPQDFAATELELHDFLRPRCAYSLEREVLELDELEQKNALMLKHVSPETIAEMNQTFATPDAIEGRLRNHAKKYYSSNAAINFE